jgi:diguanylate cyclase (GGDEF)-like protein
MVQDNVERAAHDLSSVNAVLANDVRPNTSARVELALDQSEAVEVLVEQAAEELAIVNDALAKEIEARHALEAQLAEVDSALSVSEADGRQSRHDALHDGLTGLPNAALFTDRLAQALAQRDPHGLSVLFLDVDGFKQINDAHGHATGDRVLQIVAERLQASLRSGDTVSRRSGDEFLLLLETTGIPADVGGLASRIVRHVAEPCRIEGLTLTVNVSVGVATFPADGRSAKQLLENADLAMYAAKKRQAGALLYCEL